MRTKYKAILGLSIIALLIFIGLTVHAVSAFVRNALSIIEGLSNYMICAVPFAITADLVHKEVTSPSRTTKSSSYSALARLHY